MLILTVISLVKGIENNVAALLTVHDDEEPMVFVMHNNVAHVVYSFTLVIRVLRVAGKELVPAVERNDVDSIRTWRTMSGNDGQNDIPSKPSVVEASTKEEAFKINVVN